MIRKIIIKATGILFVIMGKNNKTKLISMTSTKMALLI